LETKKIKIADISIGAHRPFVLIAGPCVIETEKSTLLHAAQLKKICAKFRVPLIFKSSYDKANRSSLSSFRGPGIKKGLAILKKVKKEFGLPILSDVHTSEEAREAGGVLDCLQIPAFLCRQTDLLVAAGQTKKAVNIKKGQFLAPWDIIEAIKKVEASGNHHVLLTERGTSFGYNNLVADFRSLTIMRNFGYPVIFDATHSVQLPGGRGACSGGEKQYVPSLARAAVAFGCDGLFLEVHEKPTRAPCDSANMISLKELVLLLPILSELDKSILKNNLRK
jgi:2-dehydro-3-deoxyphosphooctonate aldolase (KDO 8-P synthase)